MKAVAGDGRLRGAQQGRARRPASRVHRPRRASTPRTARALAEMLERFVRARARSTSTTRTRSQELAAQRAGADSSPVDGLAWIEIDDHEDLAQARDEVLARVA